MKYLVESERKTNIIGSYDVIVAGGGIAGISSALAAARNGANVLLVEKQCVLGGLATLGLITIYLPLCDGMGNQVIYGIGEELLRLSIKYGYEDRYPKAWLENGTQEEKKKQRFMVRYNPHLFAIAAEQLLISEGVHILYDTKICGVDMLEDKINAVFIENKEGRSAVTAKSIVDSTGDADICNFSKAITASRSDNALANWYYYLSKGKLMLRQLGVVDINDSNKAPDPLSEKKYSGLNGKEISEMLIFEHEQMLKDILKKREEEEDIVPVTMPTVLQVRMTRRIVGAYELDEKEVHKDFYDSIGVTGDWRKSGPVFEIPYRCLYGNEVKNLITAGRCISVTNSMWDITRVIPVCALTGEAAGTAAAMTDDFSSLEPELLQNRIKKQGGKIKK